MTMPTPSQTFYYSHHGPTPILLRTTLRTLQFGTAITIAGLYGADLAASTRAHSTGATNWVYAEVVAGLSALTCAVHAFVTVTRVLWCLWDAVLAVLWAALFGVFATVYLDRGGAAGAGAGAGASASASGAAGKDAPVVDGKALERAYTTSEARIMAALWLDLVAMLLWLATAGAACVWCVRARRVTRRTSVEEQVEFARARAEERRRQESGTGTSRDGDEDEDEDYEEESGFVLREKEAALDV